MESRQTRRGWRFTFSNLSPALFAVNRRVVGSKTTWGANSSSFSRSQLNRVSGWLRHAVWHLAPMRFLSSLLFAGDGSDPVLSALGAEPQMRW